MACFKLDLKDMSRYQIQYPLTRADKVSDDNTYLISDEPLEASHLSVDFINTDTAQFQFKRPFSGTPTVIAGFFSNNVSIGNASVYVESISPAGGTIRTSAPVTARVIVHAIYNRRSV